MDLPDPTSLASRAPGRVHPGILMGRPIFAAHGDRWTGRALACACMRTPVGNSSPVLYRPGIHRRGTSCLIRSGTSCPGRNPPPYSPPSFKRPPMRRRPVRGSGRGPRSDPASGPRGSPGRPPPVGCAVSDGPTPAGASWRRLARLSQGFLGRKNPGPVPIRSTVARPPVIISVTRGDRVPKNPAGSVPKNRAFPEKSGRVPRVVPGLPCNVCIHVQ